MERNGGHLQSLMGALWNSEVSTSLRSRLIRGTVGTFALRVTSAGLAFLIGVLFARLLGVQEYGLYTYLMSWVGLLSVLGMAGMDRLLVRNVAAYHTQSAWGKLGSLLRWAAGVALAICLGLLGLAVGLAIAVHLDAALVSVYATAWILLTLTVLSRLRQAALQGLQQVVRGQLPETLAQPVLTIALVGLIGLRGGGKLTASQALLVTTTTAGIAFAIGVWLLYEAIPPGVKGASLSFQRRAWVLSALPLFIISSLYSINERVGVLMLGSLGGVAAVGVFSAANRGAGLITFILAAANMALGPTFASLYAGGEHARLQRVLTKSSQLVLVVTAPIALGLTLFGDWFLLLFGRDFVYGRAALSILSLGYLANAATGSVGLLLIMTGHERDVMTGLGFSVAVNISLSALLIPRWGAEGAAIATAISMILWNVALAWWVWRRLGIYPTALGNIWQTRSK